MPIVSETLLNGRFTRTKGDVMLKNVFCVYFFVFALVCMGGETMARVNDNAVSLTARQKSIIPIAAFTANGDTKRLSHALATGLDNGLTINEIKEILVQMYAYAGFPRSLTGLNTFMQVLQDRKNSGIIDPVGVMPEKLPPDADRLAIGEKIQTGLVGRPVAGPVFEFSPAIDSFLKEHLFCDIFSRGVMTNQERELATVGALAALPAEAQLASHLKVCLNTGLTPAQLREYVTILGDNVGKAQADLASEILAKTLASHKN